jgi:coatomer subunit beta
LIALSNHKSHSVSFEIANSLIQLSGHPNIIKTAINLFTNLLVEQSENNIRVIILKKLMELKHKYKEILEEQVLYYTRIINSSCTNELRKLIFEMIGELITESNINSVIEILISDFNKLKHLQENEQIIEYKNMVLNSIFNYIMKFPNIKQEFPLFLIEKCLLYDSKNTFIDEQLSIIKETVFLYSGKIHKEMLEKILLNFEGKCIIS